MELICTRGSCGFRVHERYFLDKVQFTPGICPVDNGPLKVVDDATDQGVTGAAIDVDPSSSTFRRVVTE